MVSQRTCAWKLPKRFRTKHFVINFFDNKQKKFRRNGFVINFYRTLLKRFYIEGFAANFLNISRRSSVLPFFPLLSSLLGLPFLPLLAVRPLSSLLCVFPALSLFLFTVFVSYDSSVSLYPLYRVNSPTFLTFSK